MDEGYIKFDCEWTAAAPLSASLLTELNRGRQVMYELGLIGVNKEAIGFGNISQRYQGDQFIISGSATGHHAQLTEEHYAVVERIDIVQNKVCCRGPIKASSESMSHAVIYQTCPEVDTVIHIHDLDLWKILLYQVPTTRAEARYGTPEMATELIRLLKINRQKTMPMYFAMAGHEEGIIGFGKGMDAVVAQLSCLVDCAI